MSTIKTLKVVILDVVDNNFDDFYDDARIYSCNPHLHIIFQAPALKTCWLEHLEFVGVNFALGIGSN
jgi:hypothetical protein